jgi:hypothetical protein
LQGLGAASASLISPSGRPPARDESLRCTLEIGQSELEVVFEQIDELIALDDE